MCFCHGPSYPLRLCLRHGLGFCFCIVTTVESPVATRMETCYDLVRVFLDPGPDARHRAKHSDSGCPCHASVVGGSVIVTTTVCPSRKTSATWRVSVGQVSGSGMSNNAVALAQASPCPRRASACVAGSCFFEELVTGISCARMGMTSCASLIVDCLRHWRTASGIDAKPSPPRATAVAEAVGRQARMSHGPEPVHGSCHGHRASGVVESGKGSCRGQSHALHRGMCHGHLAHHGSYRCGHHHRVHGETQPLPVSFELLRQPFRPRSFVVLPSACVIEVTGYSSVCLPSLV